MSISIKKTTPFQRFISETGFQCNAVGVELAQQFLHKIFFNLQIINDKQLTIWSVFAHVEF